MWRREGEAITPVDALFNGRFHSQTLDVEFGPDAAGFLRIYERGGDALPDGRELKRIAEAEHRRAETERQRAETERQRADELQRELDGLRAEFRRAGSADSSGDSRG